MHKTIDQYLAALPAERAEALSQLRDVIRKNIDTKAEEGMQYNMPAWYVPHSVYPSGYHCDPKQPLPFVSIASQKNHMALYAFCAYCDPDIKQWFVDEWKKTGHRLDMGASCVRFKKIEQVPLPLVGKLIKKMSVSKFIKVYEANLPGAARRAKKVAKKTPATKTTKTGKKKTTRKTTKNRTAKKKTTR